MRQTRSSEIWLKKDLQKFFTVPTYLRQRDFLTLFLKTQHAEAIKILLVISDPGIFAAEAGHFWSKMAKSISPKSGLILTRGSRIVVSGPNTGCRGILAIFWTWARRRSFFVHFPENFTSPYYRRGAGGCWRGFRAVFLVWVYTDGFQLKNPYFCPPLPSF